jgi:cation:H+ antiporter
MDIFETLFADWGGSWWLAVLFITVGFAALIYAADLFVHNASKIAKIAHIPELIIGLTIVAMGTSMPELAVSTVAALKGSAGLAIGNVTGSNIFNILLILGICSVMHPLLFKRASLRYEMPFLVGITVLLVAYEQITGKIDRVAGIIFILLFFVYLTYLVLSALFDKDGDGTIDKFQKDFVPPEQEKATGELKKVGAVEIMFCIAFIILGIFGVIIGSGIAVAGSKGLANIMKIDQRIIGVTIVAFGTSLPELVTSIVAVKKNKPDIAVGNIVGSNVFNILLILGLTSLISPNPLAWNTVGYLIDGLVAIAAALLLFVFALCQKKLTRTAGIIFICAYAAYAAVTVML